MRGSSYWFDESGRQHKAKVAPRELEQQDPLYAGPTAGPVIRAPRHPVCDVLAVLITLEISLSSVSTTRSQPTASVCEMSISSPNMTLFSEFLIVLLFLFGPESLCDC